MRYHKVLPFILVFILHYRLSAQENLSLSVAIEKALSQNFDMQSQNTQVEISKLNNSWEAAGKYPNFSIGFSQNNSFNNIIKPAPFQLQGVIVNNGISPNATLNWVLFNGYGIKIQKQRLQILQQQAEGNLSLVLQTTLQNVILNYYSIKLAEKQVKILENIMVLSRQKYEYLQFKKQIGAAISAEVWQEQSNYLSDSLAVITQQLAIRNAKRNLNTLMAEKEIEKNYILTDSLTLPTEKYAWQDLQDKMLSNNINLKNQALALEILQNNISSAKAAQNPSLNFVATSNYTMSFQNLDNAQRADGSSASASTGSVISQNNAAGFTFNLPIFANGLLKRNIQTAKLQAKIGEIQTEQLKLRLNNLLQQSLDQYQVRQQIEQIAKINEKLAYDNLQLATERFKSGKINTFEYRILQENYLNVAFASLQTLYQVIETKMQLAILTGSIVEEK
jgi:outer membrane protein TolC